MAGRRKTGGFAIDLTKGPDRELKQLPRASRKKDPFQEGDVARVRPDKKGKQQLRIVLRVQVKGADQPTLRWFPFTFRDGPKVPKNVTVLGRKFRREEKGKEKVPEGEGPAPKPATAAKPKPKPGPVSPAPSGALKFSDLPPEMRREVFKARLTDPCDLALSDPELLRTYAWLDGLQEPLGLSSGGARVAVFDAGSITRGLRRRVKDHMDPVTQVRLVNDTAFAEKLANSKAFKAGTNEGARFVAAVIAARSVEDSKLVKINSREKLPNGRERSWIPQWRCKEFRTGAGFVNVDKARVLFDLSKLPPLSKEERQRKLGRLLANQERTIKRIEAGRKPPGFTDLPKGIQSLILKQRIVDPGSETNKAIASFYLAELNAHWGTWSGGNKDLRRHLNWSARAFKKVNQNAMTFLHGSRLGFRVNSQLVDKELKRRMRADAKKDVEELQQRQQTWSFDQLVDNNKEFSRKTSASPYKLERAGKYLKALRAAGPPKEFRKFVNKRGATFYGIENSAITKASLEADRRKVEKKTAAALRKKQAAAKRAKKQPAPAPSRKGKEKVPEDEEGDEGPSERRPPPGRKGKAGPPAQQTGFAKDPSPNGFVRICKKNGKWHVVDRTSNETKNFPAKQGGAPMVFDSKATAMKRMQGINFSLRKRMGKTGRSVAMTTTNAPSNFLPLLRRAVKVPEGKKNLPPARNYPIKTLGDQKGRVKVVRTKCVANKADPNNDRLTKTWAQKNL